MDCRDSALFTGVDEASCENMLRCFSAYEQRFSAGQTILTCGQQQDMIGVLLSGSAALLRLHADGNRTVLESMDEGSVFGEELAFTGFATAARSSSAARTAASSSCAMTRSQSAAKTPAPATVRS